MPRCVESDFTHIYGLEHFVSEGIVFAAQYFGNPLHLDLDNYEYKLKKGSPQCSPTGPNSCTIYLNNEAYIWGQAGHEIAHVINPNLFDIYVEGYNSLFGQILSERFGQPFTVWEQYYQDNLFNAGTTDHFYSWTYFMMRAVDCLVTPQERAQFLRHTNGKRINITAWVSQLKNKNPVAHIIRSFVDQPNSVYSMTTVSGYGLGILQ